MFEVYTQKYKGGKWKMIGTADTVEKAIDFGARNGNGGFFSIYDTNTNEWVPVNGGKKWWEI